MPGFDVLDPHLNLYQSRFIEASAGTGKTFAIENIVLRMLLDGVPLEKILIVTFTRAATFDLKVRIRKNIAKEKKLQRVLSQFDEAKIFTIHSFCFHSLREHALESDLSLEQEENPSEIELRSIVKDHLRTLEGLSGKQLEKVLRKGMDHLISSILKVATNRIPIEVGLTYAECCEKIRALPFDPEELFLMASFFGKVCNRQKEIKPEVRRGIEEFIAFMQGEDVDIVDSPLLLMHPKNRLKKAPAVDSTFLKNALPYLEEISDELKILAHICEGARIKIEKSEHLFFEDLLCKMDSKVQEEDFAEKIRAQYDVVLIDEFQDTNRIQWRIFKTLFSNKILYLVGDPKQAIYRFRHADIYTYLSAKKAFAHSDILDTNYRSTPTLVKNLNDLFAQVPDLIFLPKTGESIPCPAVKWDESKEDEGGLFLFEGEKESDLFAYILYKVKKPLSSNAVLVKDRYQAERFLSFAKKHGFPAVSKRARSLQDSVAWNALRDLIYATLYPREKEAVLRVLGGPLYALPVEELGKSNPFFHYHPILKHAGILPFFYQWRKDHRVDETLYFDLLQLVEYLAEKDLNSEYLLAFFDSTQEEILAQQNNFADAIQVLTIHMSKGLEFDTVFPIGLTLPSTRKREFVCVDGRYVISEEALKLHHQELDCEEMRQLYVAFTRAKKWLYIPSLIDGKGPINRFLKHTNLRPNNLKNWNLDDAKAPGLSDREPVSPPHQLERAFSPLVIDSFSSLYPHEKRALTCEQSTLPMGPEVGTALHHLLEKLPFDSYEKHFSSLIRGTLLEPYQELVYMMIERALTLPILDLGVSLARLDPKKMIKEMEFLYPTERGFMKGFIDLVFEHEGRYYVLDWKSNVITENVQEVMERHHYFEQAKIYTTAIKKYLSLFGEREFGGCFYYFLREYTYVRGDRPDFC